MNISLFCTLFFLFILILIGCSDDAQTTNDIRIGAVYPFSGEQAVVGQEIRQGIELAVHITNNPYPDLNMPLAESAGLPAFGGTPVQVIYADHQSSPAGAQERTRELINRHRVVALIGAYQSEQTRISSEVAEQAGIPFLNPDSSSLSLTERGYQWFFRTTPTDATFVREAFQFMSELNAGQNAGLQRLAIIRESTDFGAGVISQVQALAPNYGMQVVADIVSQGTAESVPAAVTQLRTAQPDAVLFAIYTEDAIRFMQEFKRQNYAPPLIWADDAGFTTLEFQQTLGADAAYITSREVWSVDITETNPLAASVNALYRARNGTDMNGNSVRAFIGTMTLFEAINRAASTDPASIRTALRATDIPTAQLIAPWRGIRFDSTGQNTLGDGIVVQMLDNRYTTVWPQGLAIKPIIFPFPAWEMR